MDVLDCDGHVHSFEYVLSRRLHLIEHGIINLHVLAIPVYGRRTASVIFNTALKALDGLYPTWKDVIIGISTDGERKMTGHVSGVATRFQQVAKPGFIRIWCGAHQLDLVLQNSYSTVRRRFLLY